MLASTPTCLIVDNYRAFVGFEDGKISMHTTAVGPPWKFHSCPLDWTLDFILCQVDKVIDDSRSEAVASLASSVEGVIQLLCVLYRGSNCINVRSSHSGTFKRVIRIDCPAIDSFVVGPASPPFNPSTAAFHCPSDPHPPFPHSVPLSDLCTPSLHATLPLTISCAIYFQVINRKLCSVTSDMQMYVHDINVSGIAASLWIQLTKLLFWLTFMSASPVFHSMRTQTQKVCFSVWQ